jgi:hypothetical protein
MKEILCATENCELWKSPQHIFCMLQELVTNQLMLKICSQFPGMRLQGYNIHVVELNYFCVSTFMSVCSEMLFEICVNGESSAHQAKSRLQISFKNLASLLQCELLED